MGLLMWKLFWELLWKLNAMIWTNLDWCTMGLLLWKLPVGVKCSGLNQSGLMYHGPAHVEALLGALVEVDCNDLGQSGLVYHGPAPVEASCGS